MTKPSLLLVGGGNMGRALLKAWRDKDLVGNVTVVDPHPAPELQALANVATDLSQVDKAKKFDAVILGTKPQIAEEVMPALAPFVTSDNFFPVDCCGPKRPVLSALLGPQAHHPHHAEHALPDRAGGDGHVCDAGNLSGDG